MITSIKNYILKNPDRQNPRTNGKRKPLQTKSHKEAYTYTLTKRENGKNIYICIYIKKKRKRATKSINNLPVIVSSKYEATINIKL